MKEVDYQLNQVLPINAKNTALIRGFAKGTPGVPTYNPGHVFDPILLMEIVKWHMDMEGLRDALFLTGATGCGKTSSLRQFCAALNLPYYEDTADEIKGTDQWIGANKIVKGEFQWFDGPLTSVYRHGGVFVINEVDLMGPGMATGLNNALEREPLYIPELGGQPITPHPMMRIAMTGNTAGAGDQTGLYLGTNRMNAAFMDRAMVVEVDYLKPEQEEKVLELRVPSLPEEIRKKMVKVAADIRRAFKDTSNSLEVGMSTRTLIRWAGLAIRYQGVTALGHNPIAFALKRALTNRALPESALAIESIAYETFGSDMDDPDMQHLFGRQSSSLGNQNAGNGELIREVYLRQRGSGINANGFKLWHGFAYENALVIEYGKQGNSLTRRSVPKAECENEQPDSELTLRFERKRADGYEYYQTN